MRTPEPGSQGIDHAVNFLAFTNPFVHRLTRFFFLRTVVVVERRIHTLEDVLERRQRRADNAMLRAWA